MPEETYQGWTNRETWLAYLWLTNDESTYRTATRAAKHGRMTVECLVEELVDAGAEPETTPGFIRDLLYAAQARIDFCELTEALAEE